MSQVAVSNPNAQSARMRLLVWPREHGAWGILLIPLLTGGAVGLIHGGSALPLVLFAITALALFCLRTPFESLLGTTPMRAQTSDERRTVLLVSIVFATVAALALEALLADGRNPGLLVLGGVAGLLFVLQNLARRLGRPGRMISQLIGALALTSTALGAYYVVTGRVDERAVAVWLTNWVFAGNQIHFVQLRIHGARLAGWTQKFARGRAFFAGQILMLLARVLGWQIGLLPGLVLLAFVPVLMRGLAWFFRGPEPLRVHRLGITELAHAISFGVLLVVGFCLI